MNTTTALLENYFDRPCHIYLKDKQGKILECNDKQGQIAGFDKGEDMIGLYNNDVLPLEMAAVINQNDQLTLANETLKICTERCLFTTKDKKYDLMLLSYKFPHYTSQGKLIGLMGISFDLNNYSSIDISPDSPFLKHFLLSTREHPAIKQLPQRQKTCLKHLLRGKTYREIGNMMHLSHRTVEQYVNNLKDKFGCENKKELISLFNSN